MAAATSAVAAPQASVSDYGVTAEGQAVHVYTLSNSHGMSAKILDYGGIISELNAPDRQGKLKNVVFGLSDLRMYEANGGLNSLIGRYANRLKGGFTIEGHHYDLVANPKGVTLHSGRPFWGIPSLRISATLVRLQKIGKCQGLDNLRRLFCVTVLRMTVRNGVSER